MNVKKDEWGEVINDVETYRFIAHVVMQHDKPVLIGWSDGAGTHLDLLFALHPYTEGNLQHGMKANNLFVATGYCGMFGFSIDRHEYTPGYIGEKLGVPGSDFTTEALAKLVNGVIEYIKLNTLNDRR